MKQDTIISRGFSGRILRESGFYNILIGEKTCGTNIDLYLNYERGLPLSCLERLQVLIDGMAAPDELMLLELGHHQLTPGEWKEQYRLFWGVKTPAHLRIWNGGLAAGEHEITVRMIFRDPEQGTSTKIQCYTRKTIILQESRQLS